MAPDISIQLYTVREQMAADFVGTLRKIADIGFGCVEPAGYGDLTATEMRALLDSLGLRTPSGGSALPVGDAKNEAIENALALGHKYLMTGVSPNVQEDFVSADAVKAMAELYVEAAQNLEPHGLQIAYHNHYWEMNLVEGRPGYKYFLENTPENVLWQADIYWVARGGIDPAAFLREIGPRGKILHFKDGHYKEPEYTANANADGYTPQVAAGTGQVDFMAASEAATYAEVIAVELDECATDMLEAVEQSYQYITRNGIAKGNR